MSATEQPMDLGLQVEDVPELLNYSNLKEYFLRFGQVQNIIFKPVKKNELRDVIVIFQNKEAVDKAMSGGVEQDIVGQISKFKVVNIVPEQNKIQIKKSSVKRIIRSIPHVPSPEENNTNKQEQKSEENISKLTQIKEHEGQK
ncbi:MAG: hypothetical protein EZS28_050220 [Streblomastix strix]|uniref:RRM domain-containing protein n=1 Tax=Streblomastix strix TaxID=222440 RepID=A0A5J4T8S8_9EUKA|nr:MAG: hypothetical protein EZS28_050220 [Streblomastix strix]